MTIESKKPRIEVVDALRGFAIMAIMLLHNLEHFDYWFFPESLPAWMKATDSVIFNSMFFLFSGKTYTIFSLLFGFTFYIMFSNQEEKGNDFRGRFLWRMLLLLILGMFNSLFYEGDALTSYAVFGVALVLVCKLNNKTVLAIAIICLLQPIEWGRVIYTFYNTSYEGALKLSDQYFAQIGQYLSGNSFWDTLKGNITNGKLAVIHWTWENGRILQTPAFFMLGMLLGRIKKFILTTESLIFWKRIFIFSVISGILLFMLLFKLDTFGLLKAQSNSLKLIFTSVYNVAFTFFWVSSFILVFNLKFGSWLLGKLRPIGRMTLTSYIMQSVIGSILYYGYGFGLYQYTGALYCLIIGVLMFVLQYYFCKWWLTSHKQGPLEYLWHKATWIKV
jgi:uncharacterized protein